jgi:hypothetical protein
VITDADALGLHFYVHWDVSPRVAVFRFSHGPRFFVFCGMKNEYTRSIPSSIRRPRSNKKFFTVNNIDRTLMQSQVGL